MRVIDTIDHQEVLPAKAEQRFTAGVYGLLGITSGGPPAAPVLSRPRDVGWEDLGTEVPPGPKFDLVVLTTLPYATETGLFALHEKKRRGDEGTDDSRNPSGKKEGLYSSGALCERWQE